MSMNLAQTSSNGLLCVSFNQDYSCFAVGTENGFFICDCDPVRERFRREFEDKGIGVVEMLFRCNILSLVGGGKNPYYPMNKVMIWDDYRAACIAELEFKSTKENVVRGVRLRRDRIFVILDKKVFVYNFADLKLLDEIETYDNPRGLCAVCSAKDNAVMACLGKSVGEVVVENYSQSAPPIKISAHNNPISQMALSLDGTKLATTSTVGTLVRLFNTSNGEKLHEFRRGANSAEIQSLAFNRNGTALVLSSNKGTIHIYSCTDNNENRQSSFSFMSGVVPILGSTWSLKQFGVPETMSICCFCNESETASTKTHILVLGGSGKYYKYSIAADSAECKKELEDYFYRPK